uniref:Transposase n=1 Tax=Ascaris lumbricoides TaxID=6252 RepID=A0A0M3I5Q3_ASCLU
MRRKFEYDENLQDEMIHGIINRAASTLVGMLNETHKISILKVNEYKCKRKIGNITMTASRCFSCSTSTVKKFTSIQVSRIN